MTKVLYITNGINGPGGLERVLSVKASMLAEEYSYEVGILVLNNAHINPFFNFSDKIQMFSVSVNGGVISYALSYRKGLQQTVNNFNPDIISVCDDGFKAFFFPLVINTTARIIYERHVSKLIENKKSKSLTGSGAVFLKWKLMEFLAKRFDRFIVLTEGNKKEWRSLKNIAVIPNPLPFRSAKISAQNSRVVLCVGKISYQKGQDLLVEAWKKVHPAFPDWELHCYGKEDHEFLNLPPGDNNVHFFSPEKDIQQKYLEGAIYVMSSRYEGFGMVLIEAMDAGLPCVSFDCNYGPSDIISDGVDGFLVEKENTRDLADQLIKLMTNDTLRKEMGLLAKQNVQKYDANVVLKQWDHFFKTLK